MHNNGKNLLIVLVIAPSPHANKEAINRSKKNSCPNLGIAYIAAVLKENGFRVIIFDILMAGGDIEDLKKVLMRDRPALIGITATTEAYQNALRIARICKQVSLNLKIVLGGPHVTFTANDSLQDPAVDIIVQGEGEYAMLELAGYFLHGYGNLERIKGISYRTNEKKIIHNTPRPFLHGLDELPFPSRELFLEKTYKYFNGVLTARGCMGKCFFCAEPALSRGEYRFRSISSVVDELCYLQNIEIQFITFVDDNLTADAMRVETLCDLMKMTGINFNFAIESRIDTVRDQTLRKLHDVGCKYIQFGVESGNQSILNSIRKGISIQQITDVMKLTQELCIQPICSIMIGHPQDTWESVKETLQLGIYLKKNYGAEIFFCAATPLPGTEIFDDPEKYGIVLHTTNYDDYTFLAPVYSTSHLTIEQLRSLMLEGYLISMTTRKRNNEAITS